MTLTCQSIVSPEVKLPSREFLEVETLTRQSGFSRSLASPLQKPPPPTSPWVLRASVPHTPPPPAWGLAPRPTVRCPQQLAFRLSHTLKTPVARLLLGQARGRCRRPAARYRLAFHLLVPEGISDSAQGRGPNLAIPAGSALQGWLWSSLAYPPSRLLRELQLCPAPHNPLRDSPPPRRWESGGEREREKPLQPEPATVIPGQSQPTAQPTPPPAQ